MSQTKAELIDAKGNAAFNTNTLYVDATNNRVGFGTTSPRFAISVGSTGSVSTATPDTIDLGSTFSSTAGANPKLRLYWDGSLSFGFGVSNNQLDYIIGNNSSHVWHSNGSERARIDSSGRLLVGTSSNLGSAEGYEPRLQVAGITQGMSIGRYQANNPYGAQLYLQRSKSDTVGGHAVMASGDEVGYISFEGSDGTAFKRAAAITALVDGTPGTNDMPGRLVFSTTADGASSPTEAMRINNGQELLVGYTTDNGAYKLQVNSQIFATSATIATSDGRYKENVATLEGCVDLVKALRPVSFDWKTQQNITRIDDEGNEIVVREGHNFPDGTQVGFIAQEVQEVLADKPWLGSVIKQNVRSAVTDNDGNELAPEEEFLGIAEGNLIAVLTSALQEAISEIESLKARIAALESA